ncbi:uncharacterized protein LOC121429165 isoform X1 [Lytechinus variegatus]|uniref:uncharacterized protein LOC121429165 isoform X1 n=1 Tax=Lytechinus variegatus TaxID=7654 RepID=UPI001BB1E64F|nr:uncharacterized protein LOC121429165 isoform X1 [Lytechinus variegatus]
MPTVRTFTSVSRSDLPNDFMVNFINQLGKSLNRDPESVTLHMFCDQLLCRGTTNDPMCYVEIFNTCGHGEPDEIRQKVIGISDFLKTSLKITDGEMVRILFHVMPPHHVGIGTGKILTDFMKK